MSKIKSIVTPLLGKISIGDFIDESIPVRVFSISYIKHKNGYDIVDTFGRLLAEVFSPTSVIYVELETMKRVVEEVFVDSNGDGYVKQTPNSEFGWIKMNDEEYVSERISFSENHFSSQMNKDRLVEVRFTVEIG